MNLKIMTWAKVRCLTNWATHVPHLIFIFERETECKQGRGRERGRHRIWSRLQGLSCQHRVRHGAWTHELRDHDLSRRRTLNWLSHPAALELLNILMISWLYLIKTEVFKDDEIDSVKGNRGKLLLSMIWLAMNSMIEVNLRKYCVSSLSAGIVFVLLTAINFCLAKRCY